MARSWMMTQLDYATRDHHVAADSGRISLFLAPICRARYVDFLARLYSFEAPVEAAWQRTPGLLEVIDIEPRLRTKFLFSDLMALGTPMDALAATRIVGVEQALGWMYVVERGRRLNGMLHHHLSHRLPVELAIAGNYLHSSSPTGTRWHQLSTALDRAAHNSAAAVQIMNAAHRAFRALRTIPIFTGARAA